MSFDPTSLAAHPDDPFTLLAEARAAHGGVQEAPNGMIVVLGYQSASAVLRDRRFVSGPLGTFFQLGLPPGAAQDELGYRINFLDPPDHPRVRGAAQPWFSARQVKSLSAAIAEVADRLLDGVVPTPGSTATADLLETFAERVPTATISSLLGVPEDDWPLLTSLTEAVTPLLGIEVDAAQRDAALSAAEKFRAYMEELLEERERVGVIGRGIATGREDFLSVLTAALHDGTLRREELLSLVVTLYSAGHRTTRDLFANGLYTFLAAGHTISELRASPKAVSAAVGEFLRHQTPTFMVARIASESVDIDSVHIPSGALVLVVLAAANRDPEVYEEPDRFDPRRAMSAPPLSFAAGPHHCLGAHLARTEVETMLERLVHRCDRVELVGAHPWWTMTGVFRGLSHLTVELTAG